VNIQNDNITKADDDALADSNPVHKS